MIETLIDNIGPVIVICIIVFVMFSFVLWHYHIQNKKDFYIFLFVYGACAFGIILVKCLFIRSSDPVYKTFLPIFFNICLALLLYDGILLSILPLLRKHFCASACAYLWMIPNGLGLLVYLSVTSSDFLEFMPCFYLVYIPRKILYILLILWMIGFIVAFTKIMYEDKVFRKELLKDSYPVQDADTLVIFKSLKSDFDEEDQIRLYISPAIHTPLSTGQKMEKMMVFLPERKYTEDELIWIFKHELTHLKKNDCGLKMFVYVTTAIFWFIPMSWIMKKRLAEDQELSCDELVTTGYSKERRLEYARVILGSAGDERGFSTCLSATGESLRYRLANVVHPQEHNNKKSPILFLICVLFLFAACNLIEFSTCGGAMNEVLPTETFQIKENAEEWQDYFEHTNIVETRHGCYFNIFSNDYLGEVEVSERGNKWSILNIAFWGDYIEVTDSDYERTYYKVDNTSYKKLLKGKK